MRGRGTATVGVALVTVAAGAAVVLATRAGPVSAPAAAVPMATVHNVTVGGRDRTWVEVAPAAPVAGGALVLGLPGFTETPEELRRSSDLDALVAQGVTVAYVAGVENSWNAGSCCGSAPVQRVDDLGALRAIAADVVVRRGLDPARVVLAGHSNGAMMALRAVCEQPELWAGALSVAGAVVVPTCDARGTTVVLWQGERDTVVPVAGRVFPTGGSLPPLSATVAALRGSRLTVERDPAGTHDWPRPGQGLVERAWQLLSGARAAG